MNFSNIVLSQPHKNSAFVLKMVMVMLTDKKPLSRAILDIRHPRTKIKKKQQGQH